jgi:cephalosporin hydroxylase
MLQLIGHGEVVGIDIDIRTHNRLAIEKHPSASRIKLIEGSSIDIKIINQVKKLSDGKSKVLVFLDSNHTHEHVLAELNAYGPLVSVDSYVVVFDTFIEDLSDDYEWADRPWGKGNNPRTAVWEWIKSNNNFSIDKSIEDKLLITSAPDGWLRRNN